MREVLIYVPHPDAADITLLNCPYSKRINHLIMNVYSSMSLPYSFCYQLLSYIANFLQYCGLQSSRRVRRFNPKPITVRTVQVAGILVNDIL